MAESDWVDANRGCGGGASDARSEAQDGNSRAERKAKARAGEGQKVAEASGTRLEAAEEVVDAKEARRS